MLFPQYGQESKHERIAQAIVKYRSLRGTIKDTNTLTKVVVSTLKHKCNGKVNFDEKEALSKNDAYEARKVYQAIRVYVNKEVIVT